MCDWSFKVFFTESIYVPVRALLWAWVVTTFTVSYSDSPGLAMADGSNPGVADTNDGAQAESLSQPEPLPKDLAALRVSFSSANSNGPMKPATDTNAAPATPQMRAWQSCSLPSRYGVACPPQGCDKERNWNSQQLIPWQMFAHGEYIGPAVLHMFLNTICVLTMSCDASMA